MKQHDSSTLADAWPGIEAIRDDLADTLRQHAIGMPRRDQREVRQLARWIRQNDSADAALKRPDVLAVLVPLCAEKRADFRKDKAAQDKLFRKD